MNQASFAAATMTTLNSPQKNAITPVSTSTSTSSSACSRDSSSSQYGSFTAAKSDVGRSGLRTGNKHQRETWKRGLVHGGCSTDDAGPPTLFSFAKPRDWMSMEKRRHPISQSRMYLLRLSLYHFESYQRTRASDHCRRSIKRCHEGCREVFV